MYSYIHLTLNYLLLALYCQAFQPVRISRVSFHALQTTAPASEQYDHARSWTGVLSIAATMAVAGILGTTTITSTSCDKNDYLKDPMTGYGKQSPSIQALSAATSDVKDPMTVYAKHAAKAEKDEEENFTKTTQSEDPSPPLARFETVTLTAEEERIEKATRKAKQHSGGLKIFSGNGNLPLALEIGRYLGINLGKATVGRFADGEINVVIHENVRGKDCYVIQPTCPPVNDNIMELLLMVSTLNRASARRITVVIPYYGYARQDRKMQVRQP